MADDQPVSKERQRMRSEADEALSRNPDLNCPGFEVSRVFALLQEKLLGQPASGSGKGGFTRKQLLRNVNTIFQFVVLPTEPIDPGNPRTRPTKQMSGGALRPALWYVDLRKTGTIGRGYPPNTVLGRKRKADVTIECTDRDLLHMAQGQSHPQKLFNIGRIKVKGDLDRSMRMTTLLNTERSRLFGVPPASPPSTSQTASAAVKDSNPVSEYEREGNAGRDSEYGSGAPAPIPNAKL